MRSAPLNLMRAQVRTLYHLDRQGQLLAEADRTAAPGAVVPAPRLFVGRTREGNLWHFRHDVSPSLQASLEALLRREPPLPAPSEPPRCAAGVGALLGGEAEWRGPAYLLPGDRDPGQAVPITPQNAAALDLHFPHTAERVRQGDVGPVAAVLVGGVAVAVCSCVRLSAVAAEAGVFTHGGSRGRGHARHAVALWAARVAAGGRLPLYSTAWDNRPSQAVARALGGVMFGEDWSLG